MAQTTDVMNGTDLGLYVHGSEGSEVLIAHATECSISISVDLRDTTTKDSGGWQERLEGLRSGSISASYLHAEDDTNNVQNFWATVTGRTALYFRVSTEQTGDYVWRGSCWVESIEKSAGTEDNVTYSVTLAISGAITYEEIT